MAIEKKTVEGKNPAAATKTKSKVSTAKQKAPKLENAMRTTSRVGGPKADIFKF